MSGRLMFRALYLLLMIPSATLLLEGCADGWAPDWKRLPNDWHRSGDQRPDPAANILALEAGGKGFRFDSTMVAIIAVPSLVDIDIPVGTLVPVHWIADPKTLNGFIGHYETGYRIWLSTSRLTLRLASQTFLIIVDDTNQIVTTLPPILFSYDLDNESWTTNGGGSSDARCVAAEAAELARREMQRIADDEFMRRLTHVEAATLEERLAPYLANGATLCE